MIHVAYCFDRNYQQHAGVSLTSLLLNFGGDGSQLCVHLVTDEIDSDFDARLDGLRRRFRARIETHLVSPQQHSQLDMLPTSNNNIPYMSTATWFRMMLANILPPQIGKVLYLDADTVVLADITELHDTSLNDCPIAAARDASEKQMSAKLGLKTYINTGVMLMDLSQWRDRGHINACLKCAANNAERLTYADQCAMNLTFAGRIRILDPKWNRFATTRNGAVDFSDAGIVHFITQHKPWQEWYANPVGGLYWRYLEVSPWAGTAPMAAQTLDQTLRVARLRSSQGRHAEAQAAYERIAQTMFNKKPKD